MAGLRSVKNHFVAFLGEFVGTFLFLFFAFGGTQTANQPTSSAQSSSGPDLANLLYIYLIFGFSLAINVWVFFRISGGLFNPAVTFALCITGVVPILRSLFIFVAQILGGIAASAVVRGIIPGDEVLFNVSLRPGTSIVQGLFLEMFLTTELVFAILMLAAEKTKATFVAPVGIGLALFIAELVGVYWTGGALNPARAFGPSVVQGNFAGYHWIYWLGPFLGALLASTFYGLLKYLNYEEVNGNQDKTEEEEKELEDKTSREPKSSNNEVFDGARQGSQRSHRSDRHHHLDDAESNQHRQTQTQTQRRTRGVPHYAQYNSSPRTSMSADPNRRSKVYPPEPPPIQFNDPNIRHSSPPPVFTPGGGTYVQDTEAQIRQDRSRRQPKVDQYGSVRHDMEEWEQARRQNSRRSRDLDN